MAGPTPNGLPYPDGDSTPNVPFWIQDLAEAVDPFVGDTDWQVLELNSPYVRQGSVDVTYRRRGGLVFIRWGISPTGIPVGTTATLTIAEIPEGFRPGLTLYLPVVGNAGSVDIDKAAWIITTGGLLQFRPASTTASTYFLLPGTPSWPAEG